MKRNVICFLLCLCFVAVSAQDSLQQVLRIGYVDREALLLEMPDYKVLQANIAKQRTLFESEYETMQKEYNNKVKSYIQNNKQMIEPIKLARQAEITETEKRLALYRKRYEKELRQMYETGIEPVNAQLAKAIASAAAAAQVNMVFDQGTPLYTDSHCVNLTEAVSHELEK